MCLQVLETESNDLALVAALESLTLWVKKFRETAVASLTEFIPKGIALKTSTSPGITNNNTIYIYFIGENMSEKRMQ